MDVMEEELTGFRMLGNTLLSLKENLIIDKFRISIEKSTNI